MFPRCHDQGMILVVDGNFSGNTFHEVFLQFVIIAALGLIEKFVSLSDSTGIGINHKYGPIEGIEQDAVSRFRADAVYAQQFFPQRFVRYMIEGRWRGLFMSRIPFHHPPEPFGFKPEIAAGTDQLLQFMFGQVENSLGAKAISGLKITNRLSNVRPIGVLCQHGPNHHFDGRLGRPPMQIAEMAIQLPVILHHDIALLTHTNLYHNRRFGLCDKHHGVTEKVPVHGIILWRSKFRTVSTKLRSGLSEAYPGVFPRRKHPISECG